jgi:hypothetical protein
MQSTGSPYQMRMFKSTHAYFMPLPRPFSSLSRGTHLAMPSPSATSPGDKVTGCLHSSTTRGVMKAWWTPSTNLYTRLWQQER